MPVPNAVITVTNRFEPTITSSAISESDGRYDVAPAKAYEWITFPGDRMEHCTMTVTADGYVTTSTQAVHGTGELWTGQPAADRYIDFVLRADAVGEVIRYREWDVERDQDE